MSDNNFSNDVSGKGNKKVTKSIFAKPATKVAPKATKVTKKKAGAGIMPAANSDVRNQAVSFANSSSLAEAAKKFGYSTKTISRWRVHAKKGTAHKTTTSTNKVAAKRTTNTSAASQQRNNIVPRVNLYLDSLEMLIPMLNSQPRALEYISERLRNLQSCCK